MPEFSQKSLNKLNTCDERLQRIFHQVINFFDCTILEGHRGQLAQDRAYKEGKSQLKWPEGKHNKIPSIAVDVIPYPIDWNDRERMSYFAGFVKGIATSMNINIRWGGDWDSDTQVNDNNFDDLVHFELQDA
jgi:peptidoglycan L-alanyl-D-glutamate endopeptidase CwlK